MITVIMAMKVEMRVWTCPYCEEGLAAGDEEEGTEEKQRIKRLTILAERSQARLLIRERDR